MAKTFTETLTSPDMVGKVRDVNGAITMLDRKDTPFVNKVGNGPKAKAVFTEKMQEDLPTYDEDQNTTQGQEAVPTPHNQHRFTGNYQHIFEDTVSTSLTAEKVDQYGVPTNKRAAKAIRLKTRAMKLACARRAMGNYGSQDPDANAGVGKMGGYLAIVTSEGTGRVSRGDTGADGGYDPLTKLISPYTPGTARSLTEDIFLDTVREIGRDRTLTDYDAFMNVDAKTTISRTFDGKVQLTQEVGSPKSSGKGIALQGTVGMMETDQGVVMLHYDHSAPSDAILIADTELWEMQDLYGWTTIDLGRKGLSKEKQIGKSTTLSSKDYKGSGAIVDLSFA